ncbi:MAG: hypothetical protein GY796_22940 [Chloroflexi bacterium]|nr:hypothetical protein [Chloroflexota bacterium]
MDNQPLDTMIEEALNQAPLEPLPSGFVNQVMAQVQAASPTAAPPRFRLDFLDWALPLFGSLFALLVLGFVGRWQILDLAERVNGAAVTAVYHSLSLDWPVIIGLIVIAEIILAATVGVWVWFDRPLPIEVPPF